MTKKRSEWATSNTKNKQIMKAIFKILLIFFLFFPSTTLKASDKISILVLPTINVGQNSEFDLVGFAVANTLETINNKIPAIKEGDLNRISGSIVANPRDLLTAYAKESLSIPIPVLEDWAEKADSDLIVFGQHRIDKEMIHLNLSVFDTGSKQISSVSISGNFKQSLVDAKKSWLSVLGNYIEFTEDTAKRVLSPETSSLQAFRCNGEIYFLWINRKKSEENMQRAFSAAKEGLQYDQSYPLLLNNYGYLQLLSGKTAEAKTNFLVAIENDPFLIDALDGLILVHLGELDLEEAKKVAEKKFNKKVRSGDERKRLVSLNLSDLAMDLATALSSNTEKSKALFNASISLRKEVGEYKSEEVAFCLRSLGHLNSHEGNYKEALETYKKWLDILLIAFDENNQGVAEAYKYIANMHRDLGFYDQALIGYKNSLDIYSSKYGENNLEIATLLNNIALTNHRLDKYKEALEGYKKAYAIWVNEYGVNHHLVALSYNNIAGVFFDLGEYEKALEKYEKSLDIRQEVLGLNHSDVAQSYHNIASVYSRLGEYEKAWEIHQQALEIRQKTLGHNHPTTALSHDRIAGISEQLGQYEKALEGFNKGLGILLKYYGMNHPDVATSYESIASVYTSLGEYEKALAGLEKSLAIRLKIFGDKNSDVAKSYNNIAYVYRELGEYEKALAGHQKSLEIVLKVQGDNHPNVATTYNNIAGVHSALGEYEKALEGFEKSLEIRLKIVGEKHPEVATSYNNIAGVYLDLGEYEKALAGYEKFLVLSLKFLGDNHPYVATGYNNIASVYSELGRQDKALAEYEKSLAIRLEILGENHPDVATSYNNIACVYRELGEYEKALHFFNSAEEIARAREEKITLSTILANAGYVYEAKDDFEEAVKCFREAIKLKEEIITNLDDQQHRRSYLELQKKVYESIVHVLFNLHKKYPDKGYDREALEYSDRDRITKLRRQMQNVLPQDGFRRGYEQLANTEQKLAAIEQQRIDELSKSAEEQNTAKIENLSKIIAQGTSEYFSIVDELKQKYPDDAILLNTSIERAETIADRSEDLPDGQTLVMYYPTEDTLYIFVATNKDLQIRIVEISREHLYDLVYKFREAIGDTIESGRIRPVRSWQKGKLTPEITEWAEISRKLYDLLIQPVQEDIANFDKIIVMPMGLLYYLPFEALLHEKKGQPRFLIEDKAIRYLVNSRDVSRLGRNKSVPNFDSIIVYANPPGTEELPTLPEAEREAISIKEIFPSTQIFTGPAASEISFSGNAESASIIHLATHGVMDRQIPADSYIHLAKKENDSHDGRLTMSEVYGYRLLSNNLVVLSACETSLGAEKEPGSQITTMATSFSRAKAPTVLATLWSVADNATADFMKKFYFNLQTMNKAEAKRQAQLSLLANPKTAHPLFWAPFVMLGDG